MQAKKRTEALQVLTTNRKGEKREFVTAALEKGKSYTFDKVGELQSFNGSQWLPIEDKEGHRMSISKVIYGKKVLFNSNRIEDRFDAIVNKIENGGLSLKITDVEERPVRDENGKETGDMTKVYSFNKELVG